MNTLIVLRKLFACIMSLLVLVSGASGSIIGLTEGVPIQATRRDYTFDNERLLFGAYGADTENPLSAQYASQAGLDFFISDISDSFLDECEKYNLGVIPHGYSVRSLSANATQEDVNSWLALNAEKCKDHPAIWGYDVIDEPNSSMFDTISLAVDSYRKNVDGKLSLVNLYPMYANSQQLGNTAVIPEIDAKLFPYYDFSDETIGHYKRYVSDYINKVDTDVVCVDIYPYYAVRNDDGTITKFTELTWLRNLDVLAEACRVTGRDLWVIAQACGTSVGKVRYSDTYEDIAQQAYASLAFGTKAIIYACFQSGWWDTESRMLDADGNRTETYYSVQKVNREISAFSDLYGDYEYLSTFMLNGTKVAGQQYDYLVNENDELKPLIISTDGLLVGTFRNKDTGKRAYIIANLEELEKESSACLFLKVPGAEALTMYQYGASKTCDDNHINIKLGAGEGVFIVEN